MSDEVKELTLQDFKQRKENKRKIKPVDLPEFGRTYVRSMSAAEYNWYQQQLGEFMQARKDGKIPNNQSTNMTALLLQLTVCSSEGRLLFKIDDTAWLGELDRSDIKQLEEEAGILNGIPGFAENPTKAPPGAPNASPPSVSLSPSDESTSTNSLKS